ASLPQLESASDEITPPARVGEAAGSPPHGATETLPEEREDSTESLTPVPEPSLQSPSELLQGRLQTGVDLHCIQVDVFLFVAAAKGFYPSLEEFRVYFEAETPKKDEESLLADEWQVAREQFTIFYAQLLVNYPAAVKNAYLLLGWDLQHFPQNKQEVEAFIAALNSVEALTGGSAVWVFDSTPEPDRPSLYGEFYLTYKDRLPSEFFSTATTLNPQLASYFQEGAFPGPYPAGAAPGAEEEAAVPALPPVAGRAVPPTTEEGVPAAGEEGAPAAPAEREGVPPAPAGEERAPAAPAGEEGAPAAPAEEEGA
ncbi:rhoptry neck protein ron4, partial [Cystoisospora suis]